MWNGTMFVDLDWPLNASSLLSASAELLADNSFTVELKNKLLRKLELNASPHLKSVIAPSRLAHCYNILFILARITCLISGSFCDRIIFFGYLFFSICRWYYHGVFKRTCLLVMPFIKTFGTATLWQPCALCRRVQLKSWIATARAEMMMCKARMKRST